MLTRQGAEELLSRGYNEQYANSWFFPAAPACRPKSPCRSETPLSAVRNYFEDHFLSAAQAKSKTDKNAETTINTALKAAQESSGSWTTTIWSPLAECGHAMCKGLRDLEQLI